MKTRPFALKAMLLLGFSPLYFMKLHAQEKTTTRSTMHVKIVQEQDGKTMVIDTVITNGDSSFDVNAYLAGKGMKMPQPRSGRAIMLKSDSISCATGTIPNLPADIQKILDDLKAAPPVPPVPPLPGVPAPPAPPSLPAGIIERLSELNVQDFDTIIIRDSDLAVDWDDLARQARQVEVYVYRKVNLTTLDEEDRKNINAPKKKNELQVEQLSFYPNPSNGRFRIQFSLEEKEPVSLAIADKTGNNVYSESIRDFSGHYNGEIDLANHPKGTYYLTVKQGKQSMARKLVIE